MNPIDHMRLAGQLARKTLDYITPFVVPGVTTNELDKLCHAYIIENGGVPAPLNYNGFPKSICTSVNHVVCHGIPSDKKLEEGDIVNIDVTPKLNGWHGDSSRMFGVGQVAIKAERLMRLTQEAMMLGIEQIKPGARTGNIGWAIESFAKKHNLGIVREYCGHGTGLIFHDRPQVPHWGYPNTGEVLEEGMFITVEPMFNIGGDAVKQLSDGWTVVTRDRTLSAQWEHTIAVTANGYEILT